MQMLSKEEPENVSKFFSFAVKEIAAECWAGTSPPAGLPVTVHSVMNDL